jgi:hypothetical protein
LGDLLRNIRNKPPPTVQGRPALKKAGLASNKKRFKRSRCAAPLHATLDSTFIAGLKDVKISKRCLSFGLLVFAGIPALGMIGASAARKPSVATLVNTGAHAGHFCTDYANVTVVHTCEGQDAYSSCAIGSTFLTGPSGTYHLSNGNHSIAKGCYDETLANTTVVGTAREKALFGTTSVFELVVNAMDCSRQADLVRIAMSHPAWLAA